MVQVPLEFEPRTRRAHQAVVIDARVGEELQRVSRCP